MAQRGAVGSGSGSGKEGGTEGTAAARARRLLSSVGAERPSRERGARWERRRQCAALHRPLAAGRPRKARGEPRRALPPPQHRPRADWALGAPIRWAPAERLANSRLGAGLRARSRCPPRGRAGRGWGSRWGSTERGRTLPSAAGPYRARPDPTEPDRTPPYGRGQGPARLHHWHCGPPGRGGPGAPRSTGGPTGTGDAPFPFPPAVCRHPGAVHH